MTAAVARADHFARARSAGVERWGGAGTEMRAMSDALIDPQAIASMAGDLLNDDENNLFALKASGMIDAMISDGDIVVGKKIDRARNGDTVIVFLVDEGRMVLRLYFLASGGMVRLQPLNPTLPGALFAPDKVQVRGRVMLVVRQMN